VCFDDDPEHMHPTVAIMKVSFVICQQPTVLCCRLRWDSSRQRRGRRRATRTRTWPSASCTTSAARTSRPWRRSGALMCPGHRRDPSLQPRPAPPAALLETSHGLSALVLTGVGAGFQPRVSTPTRTHTLAEAVNGSLC